jgi:hypothetical protein
MTANHVSGPRGSVRFFAAGDSSRPLDAAIEEVVASDRKLDYAIVRVRLPPGLRAMKPVRLAPSSRSSGPVYSAGFPKIWAGVKQGKRRIISAAQARSSLGRQALNDRARPLLAQEGQLDAKATASPNAAGDLVFRLPNDVGSSGSPVMRGSDYRAVGLIYAGPDNRDSTRVSYVVPINRIVDNFKGQLPALSARNRKTISSLLASK